MMRETDAMRMRTGLVLITALLLSSLLATLIGAGVLRSTSALKDVQRTLALQQAFYLAEAGLDAKLAAYNPNPLSKTLPTIGSYAVTVNTSGPLPVIQSVGTATTGTVGGIQQRIEAVVEVPQASIFQWAVFGATGVDFDVDEYVDSFDSSTGPYPYGAIWNTLLYRTPFDPNAPGPPLQYQQASVGTNSTTLGALRLADGTRVYGEAVVGAGGIPNAVVSLVDGDPSDPGAHPPILSGPKRAMAANFAMPPIILPANPRSGHQELVWNNCPQGMTPIVLDVASFNARRITMGPGCLVRLQGNGAVRLENLSLGSLAQLEFQGQVQLITDTLSMGIGSRLQVGSGSADVYVNETVALGNGVGGGGFGAMPIVDAQGQYFLAPERFTLYCNGTADLVLGDITSIIGGVYAPRATVITGRTFTLFGSLVAKAFRTSTYRTEIHQDLALARRGGGTTPTVHTWRQRRPQEL